MMHRHVMERSRTAKSIRNAKWGLAYQAVNMAAQFVMRTVFVHVLGMAYAGLNGLFADVIAMLSLAELGIGPSIVYCLYAPLAEGDEGAVARLMGLYRRAYRAVGCAILMIGLMLAPSADAIVTQTDFDAAYIRAVFLLFVLRTGVSYFWGYKASLLCADQRNHVVLRAAIVFRLAAMGGGVAVLLLTRRYIPFLLLQIVLTLAENIAVARRADRLYPFLRDRPDRATDGERARVWHGVRDLFIGKISSGITMSTDNLLISLLVSTVQTGVYSNYALILSAVRAIFVRVSEAIAGSVGNLLATADGARADSVLRRLEYIYGSGALICSLGLYGVLTPFVGLWIGAQGVLREEIVAVLAFNEFLMIAREPLWSMTMACGLFSVDKYVSILGSAANLAVSIWLGRRFGMTGIFAGTTCTLVIQIALKSLLLYRMRMGARARGELLRWVKRCALMLLGMAGLDALCAQAARGRLIETLFVRGAAAAVMGPALALLSGWRTPELAYGVRLMKTLWEERRYDQAKSTHAFHLGRWKKHAGGDDSGGGSGRA